MISKLTALVLFLSSLSFAGTAIPTNTWVQVPTKGHAVQIVGWEPMRYSPTLKRMVMQGTFQSPSSEWNTALNAYDPLTNSWVVLELGSPHHSDYFWDQGHPSSGWGIDGGILHGWGGDSGSLTFENPFIGYSYDLVGQFGRRKQPVRAVPDNQQTSTVWHAAAKKWITWGGSSFTAMWLYDPATNTMEHRTTSTCSPACPDPSLFNSTMVYRPADQQVYLWGGLAAATSDELFKYDLATDTWTVVSVTGDKPTYPRHKHAMALDTAHDVILLMGGGNASDTPYTDTWTFDFATGAWTEQSPTAAYTGTLGPFQRMDYDPENNLFVCLIGGGPGAPYTDGTWTQYPTYTWFYRYSGTGSDVGSSSYIPVAPASGALNRNADGWANDTAIAGDGTDVITAWTETGAQYDASGPFTPHPQARKLNSGTWDWLGAAGGSIAEEGVSHPSLSNWISTTLIDSVPWISYSRAVYQELLPNVNAKYWDGNSWEGGEIGRVENISGASQSRTQIIGVGLVPWVAFL